VSPLSAFLRAQQRPTTTMITAKIVANMDPVIRVTFGFCSSPTYAVEKNIKRRFSQNEQQMIKK
jgi:hypothetical protein